MRKAPLVTVGWVAACTLVTANCGKRASGDTTHDAQTQVDAAIVIADAPPDSAFADSDRDGITDQAEGAWLPNPPDADGDAIPDYLDTDSDNDGFTDLEEGVEDWDGDGIFNARDPHNDGPPPALLFTAISTAFNTPIGVDYHEPTKSVVMSVNYGTGGVPYNFELVDKDGAHAPFSTYNGLTDEVKIATARSPLAGGHPRSGFAAGTFFTGNGRDGEIVRISADGATIENPWVSLPGNNNGLMRGSLYVDRTGIFDGDLIVVTTVGEVWRVTRDGLPSRIVSVGTHLEGMVVVPDIPVRFGPLAGKIIAGAEGQRLLYAIDPNGTYETYNVGVAIEDIELIMPKENYFGSNYGTQRLLGVAASEFTPMIGDILLTQEVVTAGTSGLFRLQWNGTALEAQPIPVKAGSAPIGQWEHVTFAPAGIVEVPPIE